MKVTRPVVGIMLGLAVVQFAGLVGLWIVSFRLGDDPTDYPVDAILVTEVALAVLSLITSRWAQKLIDPFRDKESARQHRGLLISCFSWHYWQERWTTNAPYAPRWLGWLSSSLLLLILVHVLVGTIFLVTGNNPVRTYGGGIRVITLSLSVSGIMTLPVVVSKWRELSQPAASASPEVGAS
jgi:hypothetical protein